MANMTVTNVDLGSVIFKDAQFRDEILNFAAADTFVEGTILARRVVAASVAVAAVGSPTGNGTVTLAAPTAGPVVPLVGAYVLTCVTAVTHGGVFKLVDPNGVQVATDLTMTAGAGVATAFKAAGLQFTITDGSTDFAAGDAFTLTVAADGDLVPYSLTGVGGVQVPLAVLTYDVTKASSGDVPIRAMVSGEVRKERLIIDADGDGSNVTNAVLDKLRDYGIIAIDVQELNILDNQ